MIRNIDRMYYEFGYARGAIAINARISGKNVGTRNGRKRSLVMTKPEKKSSNTKAFLLAVLSTNHYRKTTGS